MSESNDSPADHANLATDILAYWQRELNEVRSPEAIDALTRLRITDPATIEQFSLGYVSDRAWQAITESQYQYLCKIGLAKKRRFKIHGCVVLPVHDHNGKLVDLCGLRPWASGLRYVHWQSVHRGLIASGSSTQGLKALVDSGDLIVCDTPFHAIHARQHGYENVVGLRSVTELAGHIPTFEQAGVRHVYLVSRQERKALRKCLEDAGVNVTVVSTPANQIVVPRSSYEKVISKRIDESPPLPPPDGSTPAERMKLIKRTETRLFFQSDVSEGSGVLYRLDATAASGLSMRVQVRAERDGLVFLDRLDLGSDASRRKIARACASRLALGSQDIEDDLTAMADGLDRLIEEAMAPTHRKNEPVPMGDKERSAALDVLRNQSILNLYAEAVTTHSGFIGEDANKRLAILVAASRLLPQPLGAMVRGPAGCGKSALMRAVYQLLPPEAVLYFSRLTPQALYFLPRDELQNKLLVCDEYEGLVDSEYALRTVMSNQTLSLAITLREGGKVPVTRTIDVPATLAVMVSTTGTVNIENLSRFIELTLDTSAEQTKQVMATSSTAKVTSPAAGADHRRLQQIGRLLRPCSVVVPYADQLAYAASSVLARRKFVQVVGLIAAHAALHQYQREQIGDPRNADESKSNLPLVIQATKADYEAVYPLLGHVVEHFEESVSPPAMRLLERINADDVSRLTRQEVMTTMNWSYSQAYRVLRELVVLDLLMPDNTTNGVLRTYEVAPYHIDSSDGRSDAQGSVRQMTPPEAIEA